LSFEGTLMESLGMEIGEVGPGRVTVTMPVDRRTVQPFGYLHGGATAALLETAASLGALQHIDQNTQVAFGTQLRIDHVRKTREGVVTGVAELAGSDEGTQVWTVKAYRADGAMISTGTCTVRIVARRAERPQGRP